MGSSGKVGRRGIGGSGGEGGEGGGSDMGRSGRTSGGVGHCCSCGGWLVDGREGSGEAGSEVN